MKTMLVPFQADPADEKALATAAQLARLFGGHVEGLLCLQNPSVWVGEHYATVPPNSMSALTREWREAADRARSRFLDRIDALGLPQREVEGDGDGPGASWQEQEGREDRVVADYARLCDLTIIGRRESTRFPDWQATASAALFESGRPVLLAAPATSETLPGTVVIAWNGSTETARTIGLGMPLLERARRVVVLTVEGWLVPPHTGKRVAEHLSRHGLDVIAHIARPDGRSHGETILAECHELGADLLFKGAYTHHRFAELIFGGATQHVLNEARLPVLLAH
ncbi:MAG: universal stress protein [Alphaproteobacteria bacterium]|jgi:nucleotide-binding universal stress UspA family protein|nr:universal stress protein [Alphaproteobacteria bacterium]